MFIRGVLTAVVIGAWSAVALIIGLPATLYSSQVAAGQFANNDVAYYQSTAGMAMAGWTVTVASAVFFFVLLAIWWKPLKATVIAMLSCLLLLALYPAPARAYYDQQDYAEVYFVLPNESAFFIPDVGANKDSQAGFGSEQYLSENKIAAKRFQIPHTKLAGSSYWANFYVPTGRLIIVDRAPYNREWVASSHRGTSPKDESLPCQSAEGLDVTVGVAISTFVTEQNAAKFLYWFGVNAPQGDRTDPKVVFTSVFYGRSLTQVMDTVGRGKVQSLVCNEIAARPLDKVNSDATKIMTEVIEPKVKEYLASRGIDLDYIGWADTFTFDAEVQKGINRRYIATRDKEIAQDLAPHVATIQAVETARATRTFSEKWNGALPSTVSLWWLPSGLSEWLTGLMHPAAIDSKVH